MKSIKIIRMTK